MAITLQSTVGGFSDEFMRKLPKLEQAMVANGLDPAEFVISKDRATPPTIPFVGPFFYDYTVFIGDENFTITAQGINLSNEPVISYLDSVGQRLNHASWYGREFYLGLHYSY